MNYPPWLKVKAVSQEKVNYLADILKNAELHTICESAYCPNVGQCFSQRTATFLIMGNICTRNCSFCAVQKGNPAPLDPTEPQRLARTVKTLGLKYVVITSVTRDDLADGGVRHFADCVNVVREFCGNIPIEILVPDFKGLKNSIQTLINICPTVISHNMETVQRLYTKIRPKSTYESSLDLLRQIKRGNASIFTKSGFMLGLDEKYWEIQELMSHLRENGCDFLTIGQYLAPSPKHIPISRYVPPEEFEVFREQGLAMGFRHVEAGPLVRSSFQAQDALIKVSEKQ